METSDSTIRCSATLRKLAEPKVDAIGHIGFLPTYTKAVAAVAKPSERAAVENFMVSCNIQQNVIEGFSMYIIRGISILRVVAKVFWRKTINSKKSTYRFLCIVVTHFPTSMVVCCLQDRGFSSFAGQIAKGALLTLDHVTGQSTTYYFLHLIGARQCARCVMFGFF